MFKFSGKRPSNLGLHDGRLLSCPSTPNCVCSYDQDAEHGIAPLTFATTPAVAWANLKSVIQALERTEIVTETEHYLHVEFTTKLMGFVDDVEFYLDAGANAIQVRSASRMGKGDLGVNRNRIESLRTALQKADAA